MVGVTSVPCFPAFHSSARWMETAEHTSTMKLESNTTVIALSDPEKSGVVHEEVSLNHVIDPSKE